MIILHSVQRAVFFDRDGTLIPSRKGYLLDPAKVRPFRGAGEALRALRFAGWKVFLWTNQRCVSKGLATKAQVRAVNRALEQALDFKFDEICVGWGSRTPWKDCDGRDHTKPSPLWACKMASKYGLDLKWCWMVGDNHNDAQAAANAGMKFFWTRADARVTSAIVSILITACPYLNSAEWLGEFLKRPHNVRRLARYGLQPKRPFPCPALTYLACPTLGGLAAVKSRRPGSAVAAMSQIREPVG